MRQILHGGGSTAEAGWPFPLRTCRQVPAPIRAAIGRVVLLCGLKLTHDGALAIVDGNRLLLCIEVEKLDNNPRYSPLNDLGLVAQQLRRNGIPISDISRVSIDGWQPFRGDTLLPMADGSNLKVAGYREWGKRSGQRDPLDTLSGSVTIGHRRFQFESYLHATDHAVAGYCSSPFARTNEPALVLVWDGGMPACLYLFDPAGPTLHSEGVVLAITGGLYPTFATALSTFRISGSEEIPWRALAGGSTPARMGDTGSLAHLSVSGKAMAFSGLGHVDDSAKTIFREVTQRWAPSNFSRSLIWNTRCLAELEPLGLSDETLLASFQEFLIEALLAGLRAKTAAMKRVEGRLCFVGGCALNIKWNTALRESGLFDEVWVPPFPNDSGSAIGAACSAMINATGESALEWSLFSGPRLTRSSTPVRGWARRVCSIDELAHLLHRSGEPVVILSDRAELGPRALGHRSIVASATSASMRERLNEIKGREWYRPVAPACLEDHARSVFSPGTPDPYMLFDQRVRHDWIRRIPAVVHVDGTARVQTVNPDNALMFELLTCYERLSKIPVLCNTSANRPGRGFFPDPESAMLWGRTRHVWADGTLFSKEQAPDLASAP